MSDSTPPEIETGFNFGTGDRKQKRRFNLHWVNLALLIGVAIGWAGMVIWWGGASSLGEYRIGQLAGRYIGNCLVATVLAYGAFFLGRRSLRAGNAVFGIVFLVLAGDNTAGLLLRLRHVDANRPNPSIDQARAAANEQVRELQRQYQETGQISGSAETLQNMAATFKAASQGSGPEAAVGRIVASTLESVGKASLPMQEAIDRVTTAGGLNLSTIGSRAQLEERIRLFESMGQTTEEFLAFYETLPQSLASKSKEEGFNEREVQTLSVHLTKTLRIQQHRELRRTTISFCKAASAQLTFLRDHWGEWEYDAANDTVLFGEQAPQEILDEFDNYLGNVVELAVQMGEQEEAWVKGIAAAGQ